MTYLLLLPFVPTICILALRVLVDILGFPSAIWVFRRQPVDDDVKAAAVACFRRARRADRKTWVADAFAPLVVPIALLFTRRSDDHLPRWASWWENNISINGDSGGTLMEDGTWLDWRDTPMDMWQELYGKPQLSYSDPAYTGDCYYCKGHHPRSFIARYVWLGWRNRASALSWRMGAEVREKPIATSLGKGGTLYRAGDLYQWMYEGTGKIHVRRNMGYKLNVAQDGKAAPTAIGWSLRRGK